VGIEYQLMIIKSLKLRNFKCHQDWQESFETGITSICGANGQGKSSILEAISWVLFDALPYTTSKVIRYGAKTAEAELTVCSSLDNKTYVIRRRTSGPSASVYSLEDGVSVVEGVRRTQGWIRHQLQLSEGSKLKVISQSAIATPQGDLTADFQRSKEDRRQIFDALLGLDQYQKIRDRLQEISKTLSEDKRLLEVQLEAQGDLSIDISTLEEQIKTSRTEISNHKDKQSQLKEKIQALQNTQAKHQADLLQRDSLSQKQESLQLQLTKIKSKLETLQQQQHLREKLYPYVQEYLSLKSVRKELLKQKDLLETAKAKCTQYQYSHKQYQDKIQELQAQLQSFSKLRDELQYLTPQAQEYQQTHREFTRLTSLKATFDTQTKLQNTQQENLQTLQDEITQKQNTLSHIEENHQKLQNLSSIEQQLNNTRDKYLHLQTTQKKLSHIKAQWQDYSQSKAISTLSLDQAKEQLSSIQDQHKSLIEQTHHLSAQIQAQSDLLPKIEESGICPLFQSKCLNLEQSTLSLHESLSQNKTASLKELDSLKIQSSSKEKELDDLKIALDYLQKIQDLKDEMNGLEIEQVHQQGLKLKEQHDELLELKHLSSQQRSIQASLHTKQQQAQELQKELQNLTQILDAAPQTTEQIAHLSDKLQSLQNAHDREKIVIHKLQEQESTHLHLEQLQEQQRLLSQQLQKATQQKQSYQHIPLQISETERKLESLEEQYLQWSQLSHIDDDLTSSHEEMASLERELGDCQKHLHSLIIPTKDELAQEKQLLQSSIEESNQLAGEIYAISYSLTQKENDLQSLQKRHSQHQEKIDQLKILNNKQENAQLMRQTFKQLSTNLSLHYTSSISSRASMLFSEIMGNSSYQLRWTEDYELLALAAGRELSFVMLSGGQQIAAAIAVRLALLREISNFRFAFFDEPTAHLDQDRRQQLAIQLSSIKSFEQLFVITHDESFAGQANHTINLT